MISVPASFLDFDVGIFSGMFKPSVYLRSGNSMRCSSYIYDFESHQLVVY